MKRVNVSGDFKKTGLTKKDLASIVEVVFNVGLDSRLRGNDGKGVENDKTINIAFVGPDEIWAKNLKYRKKNAPTDILSFDYGDEGDIMISLADIEKLKEKEESLAEATQKTIIHGVLHLLGYDHEKEKDRAIMEKAEEKAYTKLCHSREGGNLY